MTYAPPPNQPGPQYGQQPTYHSALAQPAYGQPAPIAAPQQQRFLQLPPVPSHVHPLWFLGWIGVGLLALLVLITFVLPLMAFGPGSFFISATLALIPFAIVIMTVLWIDNWEPEPKGLIVFALAWGAFASIGLTTLFLFLFDYLALEVMAIDPATHDVIATVVRAPLLEEACKMVGVFVIILIARHTIDGPIDGLVYGALIGAGFAFTENIQYFFVYGTSQGLDATLSIFFMRGILSPFAHAMFTGVFGLLVGLALRNRRNVALYALIGYVAGVALHALWNGSSYVNFLLLYIVLQVPIFVMFIVGIVLLRKEAATITHRRLGDYATAGWFTAQEVDMLATPRGRKIGKAWARTLPGDRSALMKTFIRDSTQLAMARSRGMSGRDPKAPVAEQQLLVRVLATREALLAP